MEPEKRHEVNPAYFSFEEGFLRQTEGEQFLPVAVDDIKKEKPLQDCSEKSISDAFHEEHEPTKSGKADYVKTEYVCESIKENSDDCCAEQISNDKKAVDILSMCSVKIEEGNPSDCNFFSDELTEQTWSGSVEVRPATRGSEEGGNLLTVDSCNDGYIVPFSRPNHLPSCAVDKPFECKECSKRFKSVYNLRKHAKNHTSEKCKGCGRGFLSKNQLAKHVSLCVKPYQCEVCSERFFYIGNLTEHMKVHTGEDPYSIKGLRTEFGTHSGLGIQHKDFRKKQTFACAECPKTFQRKSNLHNHLLTHTGVKPYECQNCYKRFNRKTDLSNHKRRCEKPIVCKVCRQMFVYIGNLKKHMKIHDQELEDQRKAGDKEQKPHVCNDCGIRFICIGNLTT